MHSGYNEMHSVADALFLCVAELLVFKWRKHEQIQLEPCFLPYNYCLFQCTCFWGLDSTERNFL